MEEINSFPKLKCLAFQGTNLKLVVQQSKYLNMFFILLFETRRYMHVIYFTLILQINKVFA